MSFGAFGLLLFLLNQNHDTSAIQRLGQQFINKIVEENNLKSVQFFIGSPYPNNQLINFIRTNIFATLEFSDGSSQVICDPQWSRVMTEQEIKANLAHEMGHANASEKGLENTQINADAFATRYVSPGVLIGILKRLQFFLGEVNPDILKNNPNEIPDRIAALEKMIPK